jgi:predicted GNAT family N-acyltransferase
MNIRVLRFNLSDATLAQQAFQIRQEVFVIEQGVDPDIEYDGLDNESKHYLLLADGKPSATARWRETEKGIKLERFAVVQNLRNHGLGSRILEEVLVDVIPLGKRIYLHSQDTAVHFYERHGFLKRGRPFVEADIIHYVMDRLPSC